MHLLTALLTSSVALSEVFGQAPNMIADQYPTQLTQNVNGTFFIIPVNSTVVQEIIGGNFSLIDVTQPNSVFPNGFPQEMHPVLVSPGAYNNDIRVDGLQIDHLIVGNIVIPFVDRLGDGTPFAYERRSFSTLAPPANASEDEFDIQAMSKPSDAAYQQAVPGIFFNEIKTGQNDTDGEAPVSEAVDAIFTPTDTPLYNQSVYSLLLNQILYLDNGNCTNATFIFAEEFLSSFFVVGNMTIYAPYLPTGESFEEVQGWAFDSDQVVSDEMPCGG